MIRARFGGYCVYCERSIDPGDEIGYVRKAAVHFACFDAYQATLRDMGR